MPQRKTRAPACVAIETPPATTHTLIRTDSLVGAKYEFTPQADGSVVVRFTRGKHTDTYRLPVEEARAMWRRLRGEGYEQF